MKVSVIATVLNEGESIRRLMDSLAAQSRVPDEIVIVDGGSRDNTVEIIQSYSDRMPLRVIVEQGASISRGRNTAIENATGNVIAVTDAGVHLDKQWLRALTKPFDSEPSTTGVAGFFLPDWQTDFEAAMSATVLPQLEDINPVSFLPSSRSVAFTKAGWQTAGGYPEWLDYCEDLIFDLRFRELVGPFKFAPDAVVHFRPRGSLRSFYRQYFLYARGDGKADLWRKRHIIRYATYFIAAPAIVLAGIFIHPTTLFLLVLGGYAYCRKPFQRLAKVVPDASRSARLRIGLWVPVIRVVGDVAKMAGYPVGLRWRRKNHPPQWRS